MNSQGRWVINMAVIMITGMPAGNLQAGDLENGVRHNPFKRPAYLTEKTIDQTGKNANSKKRKSLLDLRATLLSGDQSMVNISGRFYRVGEKIGDYVLTTVGEGHAVFMRRGKPVTVVLKEHTVMDNIPLQ